MSRDKDSIGWRQFLSGFLSSAHAQSSLPVYLADPSHFGGSETFRKYIYSDLCRAVSRGDLELAKTEIKKNPGQEFLNVSLARVMHSDFNRIGNARLALIEMLLAAKADPHYVVSSEYPAGWAGNNIIHDAASQRGHQGKILEALASAGGDMNLVVDAKSAILEAAKNGCKDNVASLQALGAHADQVEIDELIKAAEERKAEWARQEAERPKRSSDTSSSGSGYFAPSITSSFTTGLF